MIKIITLVVLFASSLCFAVVNTPTDLGDSNDTELKTRLFYAQKNWTVLTEIQGTNQNESRQFRSILLGGYSHLNSNLRTGFFYQRQYGVRHDEDWFKDPVTSWQWKNVNQRGEDLVLLDISPKTLLPFLPGESWTLEFKTRYEYNFFDQNQTLRVRPNLSYFWIREGRPFLNFFLQEELALALNYGSKSINERWTYIGALYHYSPSWQFGVSAAQKWQSWASTPQYTALTDRSYDVSANSTLIGLIIIFKFDTSEAALQNQ